MFSNGSSSSMSRAIVTPSLVMVGEPNFLSSTTLRPLGPIVTLTASARRSMPRFSERRAVSSKMICLDNSDVPPEVYGTNAAATPSVRDDRQDVLLADDEEILAVDLEFRAGVLGVEDLVAGLHVHRLTLPVLENAPGTGSQDGALLGLLLGGVRKDDAALGHLLASARMNDHPIAEGAKLGRDRSGFGQRAFLLWRPEPAVGRGFRRSSGQLGRGRDLPATCVAASPLAFRRSSRVFPPD